MTPDPTTPANILNPGMTEDLGAVPKRLDFDQASSKSFVFFHCISLICTILIVIAFFSIALFLSPQIVEPLADRNEEEEGGSEKNDEDEEEVEDQEEAAEEDDNIVCRQGSRSGKDAEDVVLIGKVNEEGMFR